MLSDYSSGPAPECPSPFNMAGYVLNAGRQTPEKVALIIAGQAEDEIWTYAELTRAILGTATGLARCGAGPQTKVLMRLANTVDFPIAYLACLALGAVPVPTSSALTETEVATVAKILKPDFSLYHPEVPCPVLERMVKTDTLRSFRTLPPADIQLGAPDRLGYMVFTSGTSGQPRAVCHAHRAIWARRMMFDDWYGLTASDRVMHAGAFNWTYTLGTGLMDPWTAGATAIIPAPGTPPSDLPALMERYEATIFAAAPGIYRQILASNSMQRLPNLRHGLSAGEKLPQTVRHAWTAATGCPVFEAFGMSECSTFISQSPDTGSPPDAIGRPQKGRRIAIIEDGKIMPRGEDGIIAIHNSDPGLMLGYCSGDGTISDALSGDWFLTGDQGRMDAEGFVTYLGRDDDMMNAGGFRVSPLELENTLLGLEGVDTVAVVEVTVKTDVSVIAAFYTGPAALDESVWRPYVEQTLARYKQPRLFIHQTDLPKGANGKVLRRALRDRFES